jgi:hypothetical protein
VRRIATWLLVGAVAALGLAAAVDGLRGEPGTARVEREARPAASGALAAGREEAARQLHEAGVSGVLTYSDGDCRLHALSLPELEPARAPSFEMCHPAAATGELGVVDGDVVWAGLGYGAVQVVLDEQELSRAIFGGESDARLRYRALQAVPLDRERMLVLAASDSAPGDRLLLAFDGADARFAHRSWWVGDTRAIRPSPTGRYYALVGPEPPLGDQVFTRDGHAIGVADGLPPARAVAWSPDEDWTALATGESVYVFPSERPQERVIRIPLAVRDLDWSEEAAAGTP